MRDSGDISGFHVQSVSYFAKLGIMNSELQKEKLIFDSSDEPWPVFECVWGTPPSSMNITRNEIHIWRIQLDRPLKAVIPFDKILSDSERFKANKFRLERDKRQYKVSHGAMRTILGKYLGIDPQKIQYTYSPLGKPFLASDIYKKQLHFNLSHSGDYALCALTLNRSIGIDLEYMCYVPDMETMSDYFFSLKEKDLILSLSPYMRQQAFFNLWTLKEAYLKATGKGIDNLHNIEITFSAEDLSLSIVDKKNKSKSDDWTILQLTPVYGYTSGLAVQGRNKYNYKLYNF